MRPPGLTKRVFEHAALPPQLPGSHDETIAEVEASLIVRMLNATDTMRDFEPDSNLWDNLKRSLNACKHIHVNGSIDKAQLIQSLQEISPENMVILHIREQNAGLLIRQELSNDEQSVVFEAFEASPRSENVLASQNALLCDFPDAAAAMPLSRFQKDSFIESLASFLVQASGEFIEHFAPRAKKAGASVVETRNTVDPALIREMLITLVEGVGEPLSPPILQKRVRDEVNWKRSEKPWRRSPFWLVLRVCIQRHLTLGCSPSEGRIRYKLLQCLFHAQLLHDAVDDLSIESCHFMRAKICRRLAKLESEFEGVPSFLSTNYRNLFDMVGCFCEEEIRKASSHMERTWDTFKKSTIRQIPELPCHASEGDLRLTLPNSLPYLQSVLSSHAKHIAGQGNPKSRKNPFYDTMATAAISHAQVFAQKHFDLAECEMGLETLANSTPVSCAENCIRLGRSILAYIDKDPLCAYFHTIEQRSLMVLSVFEAWVGMDMSALARFPLLKDYHSGFRPEILDVLHISRLRDMERLQKVQRYLDTRQNQCRLIAKTIFSDPCKECFAVHFFDTEDGIPLQKLKCDIERASDIAKKAKERELRKLNARHGEVDKEMAALTCCSRPRRLCKTCDCRYCVLKRERKKLRITIHEDYLPRSDSEYHDAQQKAILLELAMPESLAVYRDVTWKIASLLGTDPRNSSSRDSPKAKLKDYQQLWSYRKSGISMALSLASTTKSFRVAHYKKVKIPTSESQVLLPLGLNFTYYDCGQERWCRELPGRYRWRTYLDWTSPAEFGADANGPTSYEILSSQTRCPPRLTVHEFMAYQNLLAGHHRRWPSILRELGSSNLNFNLEETMHIMNYLSLHSGPRDTELDERINHVLLRDPHLGNRLLLHVEEHLDSISRNWRETYHMELLVTIILRVLSVKEQLSKHTARRLLKKARSITLHWLRMIRHEIHTSTPDACDEKLTLYALVGSLACKRMCFPDDLEDTIDHGESFTAYIEASIMLQDNLPSDKSSLPSVLQGMLVRDLNRSFGLRKVLRSAIVTSPSGLEAAINNVWPQDAGCPREYGAWTSLTHIHDQWIVSRVAPTKHTDAQVVHYNILQGYLLINNKPLGKLPNELQDAPIVRQLFGNQSFFAYPSALPAMTYRLRSLYNGHEIHLGMRMNKIIIRARTRDAVLEFVDKNVFVKDGAFDVPAPLVEDCVHWLNLTTQQLEFRGKPQIWIPNRPGNWILDVAQRRATRRTVALVDPFGPLSVKVMKIFRDFEEAKHITVFQPSSHRITVELKRMNLSFTVNQKGRLFSKELRCEVSLDQDAGTWYGLESMLILQDVHNPSLRSIVVPLGLVKSQRNGPHVSIQVVGPDGTYGRFLIDDVVGRVQCAPEPLLMFTKALLHAYTSFVLPDPLTRRTGTEEALALLSSGTLLPWAALRGPQLELLLAIAHLSPGRVYYPDHLKCQQMVHWNRDLTTTIQDDNLQDAVGKVFNRLKRLGIFNSEPYQPPKLDVMDVHLRARASIRRQCYARQFTESEHRSNPPDDKYTWSPAREGKATENVFEVVHLLDKQPSFIHTTPSIASLLEVPIIQGYNKPFNQTMLTELLRTDVAQEWGPLIHSFCRPRAPYMTIDRITFMCGVMAFGSVDMEILRSVVALALDDHFPLLPVPEHQCYSDFRQHEEPRIEEVATIIRNSQTPSIASQIGGSAEEVDTAIIEDLAKHIVAQWPCTDPSLDGLGSLPDAFRAVKLVRSEWSRLVRNGDLSRHLASVQTLLDGRWAKSNPERLSSIRTEKRWIGKPSGFYHGPSLSQNLMRKAATGFSLQCDRKYPNPLPGRMASSSPGNETRTMTTHLPDHEELKTILGHMTASPSAIRREYAEDLLGSLEALRTHEQNRSHNFVPTDVQRNVDIERASVDEHYHAICDFLAANDTQFKWLHLGQLWPCLSPATLLPNIRSTSSIRFGQGMREAIVGYGIQITHLQRLLRMADARKKEDARRFKQEEQNRGHGNWSPEKHTDWLLFEIDANILIRDEQISVAQVTISPASQSNSVLQMSMGKGKTSVILPIVACSVANGKALARLVVPRALLLQTAQILQARLGGLVGREIYHLPFSRKTRLDETTIQTYWHLHRDCRDQRSIIITQPDHILSFKLSGQQALADNQLEAARGMISVQSWLDRYSRNIVDECDFTLAVKTQLIYPSGTQLAVDGHPYRWKVPQAILGSLQAYLRELQDSFPQSIEAFSRPSGGFPFVYILRPDAQDALHERLVAEVCDGGMNFLPAIHGESRDAVKEFLLQGVVSKGTADVAYQAFQSQPSSIHLLHIVRGLLVHGILFLCLRKRWNVQYGLHPTRDPIAVPYHGKGIPSDQAEWGHPDVAIVLTCLAFYYTGLTVDQVRQALRRVLQSDDPSSAYARWTHRSTSLPKPLRQWNLINADDDAQLRQMWSHLRYELVVINDYLNDFVFPVHARQFQHKLQASGWDIPRLALNRLDPTLTTGFSGTNDNKKMLPLSVKQRDLPELSHTNAEVLSYLLQARNRSYFVAADSRLKRLSEREFLQRLKALRIRILIDAGAHILELDNEGLVRQWLSVDYEAPAAVYFNIENRASVIYRNGKQVPLLASPYAENLSDCLVYFDEAHTRGTDLKLPVSARGALTLSLAQTKDHTVQAAMRLRQLGDSQSVIFVGSPEVHQSILDHTQKTVQEKVDSSDVISWLLEQTCKTNEELQPLYLAQGFDFCRREQASVSHPLHPTSGKQKTAYLKALLQTERQTLDQLYGPVHDQQSTSNGFEGTGLLQEFWEELTRQRQAQTRQVLNTTSAFEEVEQERELAVQVEEIRQRQEPIDLPTYTFPGLNSDLLFFATTGFLRGDDWYKPLLNALWNTEVGRSNGINIRDTNVLLSKEFTKTVRVGPSPDFWHLDFLRPVHWILWSPQAGKAVVIIPEEAEVLIPILRNANPGISYLIVYAAPITKEMLHFDSFRYYTIPKLETDMPPSVRMDLGILAGRLYFKFEDYSGILESVRPRHKVPSEESQSSGTGQLVKAPIKFLEEWFALTRKGQDFTYTPMGYVCQGRKLSSDHPFFMPSNTLGHAHHDGMSTRTPPGSDSVSYQKAFRMLWHLVWALFWFAVVLFVL
ncbi:hypothetical protein BO94DRAFT_578003 [Aspergillus sclerotioniger CBS 115572]|uniref:ubiquitinyl hydrolase 1 n=1 Tax=Aspergillus sclerotioniger CBS 115572 TaxID=1450535 RepID=A0A317VN02_9EURO|nr:hypothetical protein BO94DRAFT_578003 [Aspergillus sclerotioniger CBS 115572]PWY75305.1 hypothetical protein BO94DRAFT_578003 [Aspergillus sclerotioniger CBS 115572]